MILRRIATAFRRQDWVTVLVEILIVVLGVFLGIQLGNWNEARAGRDLGKDYTIRLIADLEQDLESARGLISYYDAVTESINATDRLLTSPDPDSTALVVAAYRASEYSGNPSRRATWNQILSSGHLSLLPDAALESGLSDYYRFQNDNDDSIARLQDTPYRQAVRSLVPLPVQLSMRAGCSDVLDDNYVIVGFVIDCKLDIDKSMINETAQALQASATIRELLRYQYSMVATVQVNNTANALVLEQLLETLTQEDSN